MKQKLVLLLSLVFVMAIVVPQVSALEISLDENGVARFYQDSVLGRTTDSAGNRGSNTGTAARGATIRQNQDAEPIKRVDSQENKEILLRSTDRGVDVELRDKMQQNSAAGAAQEETKYRQSEKIESDRLRVEFPAAPKTSDKPEMDRAGQTNQEREAAMAQEKAAMQERRDAMEAEKEANREQYKAQLEAAMQERRARLEETVAIVKEQREGAKERLELVSRNVSARLQEGAEFVLDPETNAVRVNTPSGNSHEITHLPDQAVERMQEAGRLKGDHDFGTFPVEILERPDGSVAYKTESTETRRLFGLFDRDVNTEVTLDDETGEVTSRVKPRTTAIGRFLDLMSL